MASKEVYLNQETGMTLGRRLAAAREELGLELEKAAHDTRIRAQRLRELEADDYSQCPHPSYARMFLRDYAKYLGVSLAEIKEDLPETGACGAGGYQYLDELGGNQLGVPVVQRIKPRRRLLPAVAGVAALLSIGFLSLQLVVTLRKIDSLGLDKSSDSAEVKPAEIQETRPAPLPAATVAEDVAALNDTLPVITENDFTPVSSTLAAPVPTPDGRAAFVIGSGLDAGRQIQ